MVVNEVVGLYLPQMWLPVSVVCVVCICLRSPKSGTLQTNLFGCYLRAMTSLATTNQIRWSPSEEHYMKLQQSILRCLIILWVDPIIPVSRDSPHNYNDSDLKLSHLRQWTAHSGITVSGYSVCIPPDGWPCSWQMTKQMPQREQTQIDWAFAKTKINTTLHTELCKKGFM